MSALYEKGTPHAEGYRDVDVSAVAGEQNEVRLVDVARPRRTSKRVLLLL